MPNANGQLTAEERRRLIDKPFPVVHRHTTSYPHAGTLISREGFGMFRTQKERDSEYSGSVYEAHYQEA